MASGETLNYDLPYPLSTDPVRVAEDIQSLAEKIDEQLLVLRLSSLSLEVNNSSVSETLAVGTPVYITGHNGTRPTVAKTIATDISTFPVAGLVKTEMTPETDGVVVIGGLLTEIDTSSYSIGDTLYIGETGGLTNVKPSVSTSVIGIVAKSDIDGAVFIVSAKGNGSWGALKNGLF